MPRGDGTGPLGQGPMTGRSAGFCAGFAAPGAMNGPGFFGGFGCRRGAGRMMRGAGLAWGYRFSGKPYANADFSGVNEKEYLTNQMNFLENQLQQIKQRLKNVTSDTE